MKKQRSRFTRDELVPDAIKWVSPEEEAEERRDLVKLLVMVHCGIASPVEVASAYYHASLKSLARGALSIRSRAADAAAKNPKLVEITRRLAAHNPLGARRIASAIIKAEHDRDVAFTVSIYAWPLALGLG